MKPHDPLAWIDEEAAAWSARGLERRLNVRGRTEPGRCVRNGATLLNFASNDYLGLAADPRVVAAAMEAAARSGWGAGASPLISGWTEAHEQLAAELTQFEQVEAVALFPTGFAANLGTIAALVGAGDAVYLDRLNHACLIDGARLSGARLRVFPHADVDRLEQILLRDRGRFRRRLIATDGIFSMDGDVAPLADLADLAERFDAMLLVDEAHGTGVLGPEGRGAAAACGVANRVPIRVGTLSKALGSVGGFVAGSKQLVSWLVNHARTLIYSTAPPPAAAAAAVCALQIARAEPWRRESIARGASWLEGRLSDAPASADGTRTPILPLVVGDSGRTMAIASWLLDRGIWVAAVRPPTVPEGTARLRMSLTAAHSRTEVELLGALLRQAMELHPRP